MAWWAHLLIAGVLVTLVVIAVAGTYPAGRDRRR